VFTEYDPTAFMEAGMMLPSFGEEAVWTRQHTREIGDMHSRG
jgi:hypothetical protein